jgi:hypothetical protein
LNSILALTNYQAVVVVLLELVVVVELIELPKTEDITAQKVAKMAVVAGTIAL